LAQAHGFPSPLPAPCGPAAPGAAPGKPRRAPPSPPAAGVPIRAILLVDDEDDVREVLGAWFQKGGFQVVEAADPEAAVKTGGRLGREGTPFILVTDLGMPTSGGSSFQGGFEVVKRLWKMKLRPPVVLMAEALTGTLQARARQMEIAHFVFKPGLSKLDPEQFEADLRAFATTILTDLLPEL